jgi:hypothetical protein
MAAAELQHFCLSSIFKVVHADIPSEVEASE